MRKIIDEGYEGKTVESVSASSGEYAAIHFTDGTSVVLEAESDESFAQISILNAESAARLRPGDLAYIDVMSHEEMTAVLAQQAQQMADEKERADRQRYEELKAKFEGA